jgi:hypothetical protein
LLVQPARTSADQSIARYLFPRLVAFVTNCEPDDPERARPLVSHTLCQYVASVEADKVPAAMSLVIPTLLARTAAEGDETFPETSSRLLELAAVDQEVFRAVVGGMSGGQRAFLEEIIRSGQQAAGVPGKDVTDAGAGQPTIALKMDFGG